MKQIRLARKQDAGQITDLRIKEFSRASDFILLDPKQLRWNDADRTGAVIGVWNDQDEIVATVRMIRVDRHRIAGDVLEAAIPGHIRYPGLVFNAAATRESFRKQGFNQLLRYHGILSAREHGICSLLSPVYEKAPRVGFMRKLGYTTHALARSWQTKLLPNNPRMLAILEAQHFTSALDILEAAIPDLIREYPWKGMPIGLTTAVFQNGCV